MQPKVGAAAPARVDRQGDVERFRHHRRAALPTHAPHKESQNNPGMMVSGIVNMRDGPLGSLFVVPPGCKIDTDARLDAMTQARDPRMRGH